MEPTTLHNPTAHVVEFTLDGNPSAGSRPRTFRVSPGGEVQVPLAYVRSGAMARIAPALVHGAAPAKRPDSGGQPPQQAGDDGGRAAALAAAQASDDETPPSAPAPAPAAPPDAEQGAIQQLVDTNTAAELKAQLDDLGVRYSSQANKAQLAGLVVQHLGLEGTG